MQEERADFAVLSFFGVWAVDLKDKEGDLMTFAPSRQRHWDPDSRGSMLLVGWQAGWC